MKLEKTARAVLFVVMFSVSACGEPPSLEQEMELNRLALMEKGQAPELPDIEIIQRAEDTYFAAGDVFKDCEVCPEMVVVPAGEFVIGIRENDRQYHVDHIRLRESPNLTIEIASAFAIGRFEVTYEQYMACHADGACSWKAWDFKHTYHQYEYCRKKRNCDELQYPGGYKRMPAGNMHWREAKAYTEWLSRKTGHDYSLPSEAEWEYAVRGGTNTLYWWGETLGFANAWCKGCMNEEFPYENLNRRYAWTPRPVGSYKPNPFGLFDMLGNMREFVLDCWVASHQPKSDLGMQPLLTDGCDSGRVLKGGGVASLSPDISPSGRSLLPYTMNNKVYGFRVRTAVNNTVLAQTP